MLPVPKLSYLHKNLHDDNKNFEDSLCKHLRVTLIEDVYLDPVLTNAEKEKVCQLRETFWQNQLKCFVRFGGLNKRNNKKYEKT